MPQSAISAQATAAAAASCHQIKLRQTKQKKASCSLNDTYDLGTISREAEIRTFWLRNPVTWAKMVDIEKGGMIAVYIRA